MAESTIDDFDQIDDEGYTRRRRLLRSTPPWLISMLLHVIIIMALAMVTVVDPERVVNVLTASRTTEDQPEIEEFTLDEIDPRDIAESEDVSDPTMETNETVEFEPPVAVEPMELAAVSLDMADVVAEMAPPSLTLQTLSSVSVAPLGSRSVDMKKKLLREYGGNESSEAAVTEALKWLALHQAPNGGWTFQHHLVCNGACGNPGDPKQAKSVVAATSLALLPFFGAGITHTEGDYKDVVYRGLRFLIQQGRPNTVNGLPVVSFREPGGNLYSHGLAAIVLCEAYGMTGDPELAGPAQGALNYISWAQAADGGWKYQPQSREGGDTSVTGWMVMALKSGHMAHLNVSPKSVQGSMLFLDKVGYEGGAYYGYGQKEARLNRSCTAIGLLCRMYTGWEKERPEFSKGVAAISSGGINKKNIYYMYYATQVLRHYGGDQWTKFNEEMRDWLISTQSKKPGESGSWHFSTGSLSEVQGGRLLCTAFATMILEVYYRHMPLYADAAAEVDFPL
jgi:hypothetical protein